MSLKFEKFIFLTYHIQVINATYNYTSVQFFIVDRNLKHIQNKLNVLFVNWPLNYNVFISLAL